MKRMTAVRVLLMMLMCVVTDAPGSVTTGVFEALEDAEEIHGARRRKTAPAPSSTQPTPRPAMTVVTQPAPVLRPRSAPRPMAHDSARKIPAAAREPAAASDDH
jgi:hypothetical protein